MDRGWPALPHDWQPPLERAALTAAVADPSGARGLSRRQRRAEKQRLHEAQKKARAIDKANDKQGQARDQQGKKNKDKKQKKRK